MEGIVKYYTYKCNECSKMSRIVDGDPIPFCCGKQMEKVDLDQCTKAPHPEMARNDDNDEPCDDNRSN